MTERPAPRPGYPPINLKQWKWLREQVAGWTAGGLLRAEQAGSILELYPSEADLLRQRSRRLHMALFGMACLMFGFGVLLLISYNWDDLGRSTKVGIIFTAVAAAFAVSTFAYARDRYLTGEIAAFTGVLFYGNAIWLLAQIFHIDSHYPDGVMWWMIGALLCAHALRSKLIGLQAMALLMIWNPMEASFGVANYAFLPFAALAIWLAYRVDSRPLIGLGALAILGWLWAAGLEGWDAPRETAALLVLGGTAAFAVGQLERVEERRREIWEPLGLLALAIALLPLTFTEYHEARWWNLDAAVTPVRIAALILLAVVAAGLVRSGPRRLRESWPIAVSAAAAGLYAVVIPGVDRSRDVGFSLFAAIGFSALSLLIAIWLILRGVRLDRGRSFFAGVVYLLLFVVVRWIDLIGDMLSSAAVFFIASGVLYATARYWQGHRDSRRASGGGDA